VELPADPPDDRRSPGTIAMIANSTGTATATTHQYFRGMPPSSIRTSCDTRARGYDTRSRLRSIRFVRVNMNVSKR
jgi:hypothetical protein